MLEEIKQRFEKLVARYEAVKAENDKLRLALDASTAGNESYRKQINELRQEIETLKLTTAFSASGADNAPAKQKIERLIKEIDKCIALLEV